MKCSGISKKRIRELAKAIRLYYKVDKLYFDIVRVVDEAYGDGLVDFEVLEDDSQILKKDEVAKYDLKTNTIYIKESSYKECLDNVGRSRFTLTHEFSHYVLFNIEGIEVLEGEVTKAYEDPEWQANTLAAELLCPIDKTTNFTVKQIIESCGVSEEFAIVEINKRNKQPFDKIINRKVREMNLNIVTYGCLVDSVNIKINEGLVQTCFRLGRLSSYGLVSHNESVSKKIIERINNINYEYYKQFNLKECYCGSSFTITFEDGKKLELDLGEDTNIGDKSIFKFINYVSKKHEERMDEEKENIK